LPPDWALQDADDYLLAATDILSRLAEAVPTDGEMVGIGVDFTASTPLPTLAALNEEWIPVRTSF